MNSKTMKLCAIAVVAFFVATAFAIIPADGSNAADDSSKTYNVHFEEVDATFNMTKSVWIEFKAADATLPGLAKMLTVAFQNYGIEAAMDETGSMTGYGGNFACWYVKDGAWTLVDDTTTQYNSGSVIGFVAGPGCYSMTDPPAAVKDKFWYNEAWGMWHHLPSVGVEDYNANGHKTYTLHFDIVNTVETVNPTQTTWINFEATDNTLESFVAAANSAFALYDIDATYGSNGYLSSTTFGYNFACWFVKDGAWASVLDTSTDYAAADVIALVAGEGCSVYGTEPPAAVKDKYTWEASMDMWMRNPSVAVDGYKDASKTYNVVYELIGDDGLVSKTTKMEFEASDKDNAALAGAMNVAFVKNGIDCTATITATQFSVKNAVFGGKFSTWFTTDGKEWTYTTETLKQYISAEAIAFEAGPKSYFYNAEPPADVKDKYWFEEAFNMWHRMPDTASDFYKEEKKSNTMLYVGIGVAAVVVIAALAFVFLRKK